MKAGCRLRVCVDSVELNCADIDKKLIHGEYKWRSKQNICGSITPDEPNLSAWMKCPDEPGTERTFPCMICFF